MPDGAQIPLRTESGERRAWAALEAADPRAVCRRAAVARDEARECYLVAAFGQEIGVRPGERRLWASSPGGSLLLGELRDLFVPALLVHLASAKEVPSTGRLVRPEGTRGGNLFAAGSHVLPLDRVARRFGRDREGFLRAGSRWGGTPEGHGDASLLLHPLPRLPTRVLLWLEDEEFPPRADLLLDSSCDFQAPADVLWATTTVTVLLLLRDT